MLQAWQRGRRATLQGENVNATADVKKSDQINTQERC
jgi:hypothetical protein